MKQLLPLLSLALMLGACAGRENELVATPGLYVRHFESEFASGWDSVWIEVQLGITNGFLVRHHTATVWKDASVVGESAQKNLVLPATWHREDRVLVTTRLGRRYSFPEKDVLMLGTAKYERVGNG